MAKKEKPSRPPNFSPLTENLTVDFPRAQKTDLPEQSALTPPSADDAGADPTRRASEQLCGQSATPRTPGDRWDPLKRYWSERNSFPDYGNARGSTMSKLVKSVGSFVFGNYLNGQSARPGPPPTTAKRSSASEAPLAKPSKRPRTDEDEIQEVVSVDGSSDLHETPQSGSSVTQRKTNHQGSQSLRSSGDTQSRGLEIDEYRKVSKFTAYRSSNKRSKHKKTYGDLQNGHTDQDEGATNSQQTLPGHHFLKKRPLLSQRKLHDEDILDDKDVEYVPTEPRQPRANGRGNLRYTNTTFMAPSSDDELSKPQPRIKLRDAMVPAGTIRQGNPAANGIKRSAKSSDGLQTSHQVKRRARPSHRADIPSTRSTSTTMTNTPHGVGLRVDRAVCEPDFIYPAERGMREDAQGATNELCYLIPADDDPRIFNPADSCGKLLNEMEWVIPNFSKVIKIARNDNSPIVGLWRRNDLVSDFLTGTVLFIEFGSRGEAKDYVETCQRANPGINFVSMYDHELLKLMEQKLKIVKEHNFTKRAPGRSPDARLPKRHEIIEDHSRPANARSNPPEAQKAGHFLETRAIRAQMRAHGGSDSSPAHPKLASQGRTPRTPAEEKQLRKLVEVDDNDDGEERVERCSEGYRESPSRSSGRVATFQPVRNLRSSKPRARSPSPVLETWTEKNPDWVADRNYRIPLIYERTTINVEDIQRLDEGQFLNDEIISFYAKYLHKQLEKTDEQMARKVYVFSSFFWEKLRAKGYDGVKTWTAKIDLLSYDYIVVPINQNAHWYLALICNPGGLLPQENTKTEDDDIVVTERDGHADTPAETKAPAKSATVVSDMDLIPLEDQPDGSESIDLEETRSTASAKKAKMKRGPGPRKYDPKAPRVITLDSLDGSHTYVATSLKTYLKYEIKQRKGLDIEMPSPFGMSAKDIPFQTNFTDCGVYLLGYLEEFMKDPYTFTRKILQQEGRDWNVNAPALRNKIRDLIFELQVEYQVLENNRRREKRLMAKAKAKSQTPAAEAKFSPQLTSEQPVQQTPAANSSTPNSRQQTPSCAQSSPIRSVNRDQASVPHDTRSSVSLPPLQRPQASSTLSVNNPDQSQEDEPDPSIVNASMIVNLNDSVEISEEMGLTKAEAAPRVMQSVEAVDQDQMERPPLKSPTSQRSLRSSETPQHLRDGDYDEKRFMKPIPSSPPSRAESKGSTDQWERWSTKTSAKISTPRHDEIRSYYFTSSSFRPSSPKTRATPKGAPSYTTIPSSGVGKNAQGKAKSKDREKPSEGQRNQAIDLTDD